MNTVKKLMIRKTNLIKAALPLVTLLTLACSGPLEKVSFTHPSEDVTVSVSLSSYDAFVTLIETEATFILTITNARCSCTADFMPHYDRFLSEYNIVGYTLEYTFVLYETEKYGLPVVDANSPILTIYDAGVIKYSRSYKIGDANFNRTFTDYQALVQYLEARIDVS